MVTRVLAKTAKVKNNFINGKKKFKRILSCLFGGRRKVQVTNLPSRGPFLETPDNFPGPVSIFSRSFIYQLIVIIGANLAICFTIL